MEWFENWFITLHTGPSVWRHQFQSTCKARVAATVQENAFHDGSEVAVILCGHKDMSEVISKQMQGAGVQKERILTNY